MRSALQIDEQSFSSNHPNVALDLNNLARLLQDTKRLREAEPLMRRSLAILPMALGFDHPNTQGVKKIMFCYYSKWVKAKTKYRTYFRLVLEGNKFSPAGLSLPQDDLNQK